MNKLIAAAVAGCTATAMLGSVPTAHAGPVVPARSVASATRHYNPPPIHWKRCHDATLRSFGAKCGRLIVPLDYAHPHGRTISLAVSRVRHTSSAANYQGVMLTNPGGPGASGLILSILGAFVPHHVGADYDWIGFDPRGVGASRPSLTCNPAFFHYDRPNYIPTTKALLGTWRRRSARYAADCGKSKGRELLDHVTTADTVADMDTIRRALGVKKISYYGFSYGTYLGQVYATLHPNRVHRMVLDSNVDPTTVWYKANLLQDIAFQKTERIFFTWLAKYNNVYHLGKTEAIIERRFDNELSKLDHKPAGGIIGPDELSDVMLSAGYYVLVWLDVAKAYSNLMTKGKYGGIKRLYDESNSTAPGGDNGFAMYIATECTDAHWPQNWSRWARDNWRIYPDAPFLTWANAWFNGPCIGWPGKPQHPVPVVGHNLTTPMLMIDETYDAATPYSGNLNVRARFPSASLIEGVDGSTHAGSLNGDSCIDNAIARYLATGDVPARTPGRHSDLQCPPLPQPTPGGGGSMSSQTSALGLARMKVQQVIMRAGYMP